MKPRAFIIKPLFTNFNLTTLQYLDVLTYISVKSFDNEEGGCFPAYETIAEKAGLSRTFVIQSIERLKKNGYINILKRGYRSPTKCYPNLYGFGKYETFNPIPPEFLKINDLSANEKAMLLLLRQFAFSPCDISGSINDFATDLGLTYNIISKQLRGLIKKGYLKKSSKSITKLLKIDWHYPEHHKAFRNKSQTKNIDELGMLFMDTPGPRVLKLKEFQYPEEILLVS